MNHDRHISLHPEDLYNRQKLCELDDRYLAMLDQISPDLKNRLVAARKNPSSLSSLDESALILETALYLEQFIVNLFHLENALSSPYENHRFLGEIAHFKKTFIQKRALNHIPHKEIQEIDSEKLNADLSQLLGLSWDDVTFYKKVSFWLKDEKTYSSEINLALRYACWAVQHPGGHLKHRSSSLFKLPQKINQNQKIHGESTKDASGISVWHSPLSQQGDARRCGFNLTDPGLSRAGATDQAHYCLHCHTREKDSCSRGFIDPKSKQIVRNSEDIALDGCPLDEKISEMNILKTQGFNIAALATIVIDNPMVAATGHRICNDCMKSCIFQKQDPVNIPGVETQILREVLDLDWGFEIYSLLTRWNPLNIRNPLPKPKTGYTVLIAGMGPAGFTLAHYLLNEGHTVVGIDGLKIEPIAPELSGRTLEHHQVPFSLVRRYEILWENLGERVSRGFGGVAEYGITVRWDKNFLTLIQLLLLRRSRFDLYDGVRLGGTLTPSRAFNMGFDHVALCLGAGKPRWISIPNGLAKGVRLASDFLMALQLTGAARQDSTANLLVRLPIVVLGGGLTAVDTATEALAYYPEQVKKFKKRYWKLADEIGEETLRSYWPQTEQSIVDEFLAHAQAIEEEEKNAARENRASRTNVMLQSWGGATLVYRKAINEAPSYRNNVEELNYALKEGIQIIDNAEPLEGIVDHSGYIEGLRVKIQQADAKHPESVIKARTILMAAGTSPNIVIASEDPESGLKIEPDAKNYFSLATKTHNDTEQTLLCTKRSTVISHIKEDGRATSILGDLHPEFAGNVVKAMASAKIGYHEITQVLQTRPPQNNQSLRKDLAAGLSARVHHIQRLTPKIIEIVVHAPFAAQAFQPGQFYRLQTYETLSPRYAETSLATESLAMTGARVDRERGLIALIILEMGGSSNLISLLKSGDPIVLLGPTGSPTMLPAQKTVALLGGGLGNAVLFSIGQSLRAIGSRVIYFAGYKEASDIFHRDELEAAADILIWCCDAASPLIARRPQDQVFIGNIVNAVKAYGQGSLVSNNGTNGFSQSHIRLDDVEHMIVIGSDGMMSAVARARNQEWLGLFPKLEHSVGSINSPMQCMMKEICGQCLQRHVDPFTNKESVVFSCVNQDQNLDYVDFDCLKNRLEQNKVHEILTQQWLQHCFRDEGKKT